MVEYCCNRARNSDLMCTPNDGFGWRIMGYEEGSEVIQFCPFCGVKLE